MNLDFLTQQLKAYSTSDEKFQLFQLAATPILPLTAIKTTNLAEMPVQYPLFHKALLWNCHFCECVCWSVCNLQRLRQTKTNPERHNDRQRDIKRRWSRDIESSQKEKDLRQKQFVQLHNGWTRKWKWSLCSAKGEFLFMGHNYHYIRPQLFSGSSFRLSSISHRQKSPISSHIHNQ